MLIVGIGGLLRDAAAAVIRDGELVAAIEEEKLRPWTRRPGTLPLEAIRASLAMAGAKAEQADWVILAGPLGAGASSHLHVEVKSLFPNGRIRVVDHHTAHAASAFFASPFERATVLTLDRAGDMRCGALWRAEGNALRLEEELYAPDSPADFYGRITTLLGFRARAEEHKVQWLSAAGSPAYADLFRQMMGVNSHGWPSFDRSYFDTDHPTRGGFSEKFFARLGVKGPGEITAEMRLDIAASVQRAIESVVLDLTGSGENLCLAGGLALNALLVAALENSGCYQKVYVQPAAGNSGTALGAALYGWHHALGRRERVPAGNLCYGPGFDREEIKKVLENCKLRFRYLLTEGELIDTAVRKLADRQIVAWYQGRMEFGPRALGNRSILASPLNPYSTENLNLYIKHREPFRKFAASVPAERAGEYFQCGPNARFLATVSRVRAPYRQQFEAALLGGDLIRVHAVHREDNPLYWELLEAAGRASGLPVLYNTSFNLFGEPLVCDPRDAVRSFYSSGIDSMFVGNFFLEK
ncbi:MAG TPA: carbamoyltransferase C-terminal domain-containing protein [Bryobacterales bacterium]|nr:carbamoyltransferase C-terminal domain-containing protein [Bryobacterales bacterium]